MKLKGMNFLQMNADITKNKNYSTGDKYYCYMPIEIKFIKAFYCCVYCVPQKKVE